MNGDPAGVRFYFGCVLADSHYPDYLPRSYDLDYNPDNRILIADFQLPSIDDLPTLSVVTASSASH